MADTIFSKILRRELPADIVHEDEQVLAIRDIAPQAPTHIIIIPKKAIPTSNDVAAEDEQLVGHMVHVAARIAALEGIAESGYRLIINCNHDGGQTIPHLHLHLLGGRLLSIPIA